jgi:dipeptidyl-peptidase-4
LVAASFAQDGKKEFTSAEIFTANKFKDETLKKVHWARDSQSFFYNERDTAADTTKFMRYQVASGRRELVLPANELVKDNSEMNFKFTHNIWSPDEKQLLFTGTLTARQTKTGGNFYLADVKTKRLRQLTNTTQQQVNVNFSPDGKFIAFVRNNNLVLMNLETGEEKSLTHDGQPHVLNGHFDWVYEEEFSIIEGWQWSPDSRHIGYWQIDERRVPEFDIALYDSLHLNWNRMRYPKAGDPNSMVKIGVVNVKTGQNIWMDIGSDDDIYIARINWLPASDKLSIQRLNRLQNKLELLIGDITTGKTDVVFTDTDEKYLEVHDNLMFLKTAPQFLWTSERDGFNHIYLYTLNGQLVKQLTKGEWDVSEILGVDEKNRLVYFMASEVSPLENHLYSIDLNGKNFQRVTQTPGWHSIKFAPDFSTYLDTYSQINVPPKIGLFNNRGELKNIIVDNRQEILNEYQMSRFEFLMFEPSDGIRLNGYMLKPADFDATKKYPVLMYVYGGPGSQTVQNRWGGNRGLWFQMLAQKGYIVASVDNRGTGARGAAFKKVTYKNMGTWETHDQIEAARYLGTLTYIDKDRIGIFGWSYGGFMASLCLFKGHDVFKTAIAVAPVTHWKFYDSIYTERYMQTPQLNPSGYEQTAPLAFAKLLTGNFLLIHGTADDNVHFQNSVALVNELIAHNKQFQTMFYPGRYHGIKEVAKNTQEHIYTLMADFILEKL